MGNEFLDGREIPKTMSTQHPDNASAPLWSNRVIIDGDAEIYEAYFAYKTLGCQEVMWDSEGKDVDTRVVRKLLTKYGEYFKTHILGKDVFLTYRIPNPRIDTVERKIIVETLQNIPVAYDIASVFYKSDVSPIFEVILPFTTDSDELIWLHNYYEKAIVATENVELNKSARVKDWIGSFKPKRIQVIPLVEDFNSISAIDKILNPYIDVVKPRYLRVFIARSDPALNYGLFTAVLLVKLALSKLKTLEVERDVPMYPILGVGTMPFRGHLSPENCEDFLCEYKGLSTVTIQSAFKYDCRPERVKQVVSILNEKLPNGEPTHIEPSEEITLYQILRKARSKYESVVEEFSPLVNSIAAYVPSRRARKLHIGLFGYSRSMKGITLPRAIPFAAAFYSLGIPPEFLGGKFLNELQDNEWILLQKYYCNMKNDLNIAGGYTSWQNINLLKDMQKEVAKRAGMSEERLKNAITKLLTDLESIEKCIGIELGAKSLSHRKYENFTNNFIIAYLEHEDNDANDYLLEAAKLRACLG